MDIVHRPVILIVVHHRKNPSATAQYYFKQYVNLEQTSTANE
jgi:hypothetical protein